MGYYSTATHDYQCYPYIERQGLIEISWTIASLYDPDYDYSGRQRREQRLFRSGSRETFSEDVIWHISMS